jgi:hypothetical protein
LDLETIAATVRSWPGMLGLSNTVNSWLGTVGLSIAGSMAGVYWLSKALIQYRLKQALDDRKAGFATELADQKASLQKELEDKKASLQKELEDKKASLQRELDRDKAQVEGAVRREVELFLGDRAAERQYASEARRRLYLAIGPLRFQLLLACRDFAGRIETHPKQRYGMELSSYYGRTTLYRLLRPLAIAELMERQIAYSDFAVDDSALDCLRFKKSVVRILSSHEVIVDHPRADWSRQSEHVFADSIGGAANALVCESQQTSERLLRFDEFDRTVQQEGFGRFEPFAGLINDFAIARKPILWLRLVAYGNTCNSFVVSAGAPLGFEKRTFPVRELIEASADKYVIDQKARYEKIFADHTLIPL